jgi:cell division protein FtsQ
MIKIMDSQYREGRARKGAVMAKRKNNRPAPYVFQKSMKLTLLLGLIFSIAAALVWFEPQHKFEQLMHRPINAIQVDGTFHYVSKADIELVVNGQVGGSFLDLNIAHVKQLLEQNPWIDSASVARVWPDRLVVKVVEQQPIARWGDNAVLNMRGDIVQIERTTKIDSLPFFKGDDRYAKEIMQQYLSMGKLLAQSELELAAVDLDKTMAWTLTLSNGVIVKLGRDRLWEKLHSLLAAKKGALAENFNKVERVDMRYPGGFAVAWKAPVEDQYVAGG